MIHVEADIAIDFDKLRRGLAARYSQLEALKADGPGTKPSFGLSGVRTDALLTFIFGTIGNMPIKEQLTLIGRLSSREKLDLNEIYAVGAIFSGKCLPDQDFLPENDEVYSVIVETLLNAGCFNCDMSGYYIFEFNSNVSKNVSKLIDFSQWDGDIFGVSEEGFIESLRTSILEFRKLFIRMVGPDICSSLQVMLDCNIALTDGKIEKYYAVHKRFELDYAFLNSLILKIFPFYREEREFLGSAILSGVLRFSSNAERSALLHILERGNRVSLGRPRSSSYKRNLIWLYYRIHCALIDDNVSGLCDAILDIYCFDKSLIPFLEWKKISLAMRNYSGDVDARITFVTYLMNTDSVKLKFPYVYISYGIGALISDLTSLIKQSKSKLPIHDLVKKIRSLKRRWPAAASALIRAILQRSMVERISVALLSPAVLLRKNLPHVSSNKVSVARLQLLFSAQKNDLLSKAEWQSLLEQELDIFKIDYFRGQMLGGRVRIAWDDFEAIVDKIMEKELGTFDAVSRELGKTDEANQILFGLSRYVSDKISDSFLYDSKSGIDQSLSNNLRHGIILPRFLRAFEDALQTTVGSPRGNTYWESDYLKKIFGPAGSYFLTYRDYISDRIKNFVEEWLIIPYGGSFDNSFRHQIAESIFKWTAKRNWQNSLLNLRRSAKSVALKQVQALLKDASEQLSSVVKRDVVDELNQVRSALRGGASTHSVRTFLDCLDTNLDTAFQEVGRWIHLAESHRDFMPFKLSDSVGLHLLSTSSAGWQKLNVSANCYVFTPSGLKLDKDYNFPANYWEVLQSIVHNLLSNAFRYSGEGTRTKVSLDVQISESAFLIKCTNSMSARGRATAIKRYLHAVAMAKNEVSEQARHDQSSGFQKMRHAIEKKFNVKPEFNIPLVSELSDVYTVEVVIEGIENNLR